MNKIGENTGNRGKGRPAGSPNKISALLKDAVLKAATKAGDGDIVAYLSRQAVENPAPFLALLGKILPMQLSGDAEDPIVTRIELVAPTPVSLI